MDTIFVVCQHGDEVTPLKILRKDFKDNIPYIIANPKALEENKRFVESDLNRSFSGKNITYEEKLAQKLLKEFKKYSCVIDFHTSTAKSPIFAIITKPTKAHLNLAQKLGIGKIVYMKNSIAQGNALIDSVKLGISVECGPEGSDENYQAIKKSIKNYLSSKTKKVKPEYYEIYGTLKAEPGEKLTDNIQSFKLVKKDEQLSKKGTNIKYAKENFYPIMPREKSYIGILCVLAKKVKSF